MESIIDTTNTRTGPSRTEAAAVTRSEWRLVGLTILVVLVLTSLPYLYGYLTAPRDQVFTGIMLDVPDHGQYFSWMRELGSAHLSANKLTPEANRPVFFNLLWWGLGRLDRLLGLGFAGVFQILRFSSTILFLFLVYRVISWFLADRLHRLVAFLLVVFTSGFGWALVIVKYLRNLPDVPFPLDLYVAEGNTFLSILGYPHFIAAALYIFAFDLVLRGETRRELRYAVAAGLVALFLGWQHAYDLVLVWGILASYAGLKLVRDRRIPFYLVWSGLIIGLISFSPALYSVVLTSADPVWEQVLAQFANAGVYTPNLLHLPILLGIIFPLALLRLAACNPFRLANWDDKHLFLLAWFGANFFLIYIPTDYQIHMLNGWQVPMSILAAQALFYQVIPWLANRLPERLSLPQMKRIAPVVLLLSVLPTNLYLFAWRFVELARHDYPYYLFKDELAGMEWLEANGSPSDVVLSSLTIGQYLPALTGQHAFLAHWAQTLDFYGKEEMVARFFDPATADRERIQILEQYRVDYVFWGPAERQMGAYSPAQAAFLVPVYQRGDVMVFRFVQAAAWSAALPEKWIYGE